MVAELGRLGRQVPPGTGDTLAGLRNFGLAGVFAVLRGGCGWRGRGGGC